MLGAGPVPPVVPPRGRGVRVHHQLPRVLHGAGRQQPGHGVPAPAQRDHRRLRRGDPPVIINFQCHLILGGL